jgi:hypothetical protein
MNQNQIKEIKYLRDLKEFLNELNEDQLVQPITIEFDESPSIYARKVVVTARDFYINKSDSEDYGTLSELQEIWGRDFDIENYKLFTPAGTIYLTN